MLIFVWFFLERHCIYMSIKIHLNDAQGPNDARTTFCYTFFIKHLIMYFYSLEPTQSMVKYQVAGNIWEHLRVQIIDSTSDLLNHHLHLNHIFR